MTINIKRALQAFAYFILATTLFLLTKFKSLGSNGKEITGFLAKVSMEWVLWANGP